MNIYILYPTTDEFLSIIMMISKQERTGHKKGTDIYILCAHVHYTNIIKSSQNGFLDKYYNIN